MTVKEKVGQMAQITLDVIGKGNDRYTSFEPLQLDEKEVKKALGDYHIGSVLNTANNRALPKEKWYEIIKEIQDFSINKTRLGIPNIYGGDEIHGATYTAGATMFPQQIAQGAARNPALTKQGAAITAYETRASNIPWSFSPVLDYCHNLSKSLFYIYLKTKLPLKKIQKLEVGFKNSFPLKNSGFSFLN